MQETGEFYVFNDDVDYILDALADNNPIATRYVHFLVLYMGYMRLYNTIEL